METKPIPAEARFVWIQDQAPPRNQFVRFERRFHLADMPASALLHLFADTRYRLRVNGSFVATGPGRFVTQYPEYDTHELAPLLKWGSNVVEVEVNFYGASSYQSMPDGAPGFMAWGQAGAEDLSTPGSWTAFRLRAWRHDAPSFSFAQGPVEICDTRLLDQGEARPLVVCQDAQAPWGPLRPYSGPPIPFRTVRPKRIELAGTLIDDEKRVGFMAADPDCYRRMQPGFEKRPWTAFATWIHAEQEHRLTVSAFWSDLKLNSQPVAVDTRSPLGNHGRAVLDLRAGWNLLVGEVEVLTEYWAYILGIPREARVSLHACQDQACLEPLAIAPAVQRENLRLPAPGDSAPPAGWQRTSGDLAGLTPARIMAWERPAPGALRNLGPDQLGTAGHLSGRSATWCFSFAGEFLGHLALEVEAPAGSILDIACDDWPREDGAAALYRSHPFTNTADRFILRGGRQAVDLFHPRGGKLVQVTLRAPAGMEAVPLLLHDLRVRSRLTFGPDESRFQCDQETFNWAWPVSLRTLQCSADESYADCPWRERGSYIGDNLVNVNLHSLFSNDWRVAARTLRIFGEAQRPDGQLPGCAPAWLRVAHEDFTLLWILAVRDYGFLSGDLDLVRNLQPVIERIWSSPTWEVHASGLWSANHTRVFIDWGVVVADRTGEANAVLNLLRIGARRASADMARALGQPDVARVHEEEAARVERAVFQVLWDDQQKRLRPSLSHDSTALHANILALHVGAGNETQRAGMLAYVGPLLEKNLDQALSKGMQSGHLELFYLSFALPALARQGRPDLAERLVDTHYGYLMKWGDDTMPETFARVEAAHGSRCHSWSGAAAVYAARYILGIRPDREGRLYFEPVVHGIGQAKGRIAHPKGWIDVAWKRDGAGYRLSLTAPPGVDIDLRAPCVVVPA